MVLNCYLPDILLNSRTSSALKTSKFSHDYGLGGLGRLQGHEAVYPYALSSGIRLKLVSAFFTVMHAQWVLYPTHTAQ